MFDLLDGYFFSQNFKIQFLKEFFARVDTFKEMNKSVTQRRFDRMGRFQVATIHLLGLPLYKLTKLDILLAWSRNNNNNVHPSNVFNVNL